MTPRADRAARPPHDTYASPKKSAGEQPLVMVRNDSGTTATTTNDDDGAGAWDLSLTAGRTGGGRPESSDPSSRAELAERRLMETQQVLVQERAKREVAEAILAETAKALSAVRRAAADGGAASTSGVALRGGGEEAANARLDEHVGGRRVERVDALLEELRVAVEDVAWHTLVALPRRVAH